MHMYGHDELLAVELNQKRLLQGPSRKDKTRTLKGDLKETMRKVLIGEYPLPGPIQVRIVYSSPGYSFPKEVTKPLEDPGPRKGRES